jgi:hypothetical protein
MRLDGRKFRAWPRRAYRRSRRTAGRPVQDLLAAAVIQALRLLGLGQQTLVLVADLLGLCRPPPSERRGAEAPLPDRGDNPGTGLPQDLDVRAQAHADCLPRDVTLTPGPALLVLGGVRPPASGGFGAEGPALCFSSRSNRIATPATPLMALGCGR